MGIKQASNIDMQNAATVINVPDPVNPQDVATRAYVLANGGGGGGVSIGLDAALTARVYLS